MPNSKIEWYAYLHKAGSIHVRRYFDVDDIKEADESPFVSKVIGPFEANNSDDARHHAENFFKGENHA